MDEKLRIMTENPLNAETPVERLRTWITGNDVFFKRNQGMFPKSPVDLDNWSLTLDGYLTNDMLNKIVLEGWIRSVRGR